MKNLFLILFSFTSLITFGQQDSIVKDYFDNGKVKAIYRYHSSNGHELCRWTLYNANGTRWTNGHYTDGTMDDSLVNYASNGDTAFIEIWKMGNLWSKEVFYQVYPDNTYKPISKSGFFEYKGGQGVHLDKDTPDGYIEAGFDMVSKSMKTYIWQNGQRQPYEMTYSDGTIENIYNGDSPGIYKWENKRTILVRRYTKKEIKAHQDSGIAPTIIQTR